MKLPEINPFTNRMIDDYFDKKPIKTKTLHGVQTKLGSITETMLNVGSGIITANLCWHFIIITLYPALNTQSKTDVFMINLIFTFISILRGFLWRRIFVWMRIKNLWKHA